MRKDILKRKSEILQWINENKTKAQISSLLYCKQETLNRYLKLMGIEYKGNQSGKGYSRTRDKMTLVEYLANSKDI